VTHSPVFLELIALPSNKKKRLYKMFKHLGNPLEKWWLIDENILSKTQWETIFLPLWSPSNSISEEKIQSVVDAVYGKGQVSTRLYWLDVYNRIYLPLVHRCVVDAQEQGVGMKTISSVYLGSRNFPVWTDCYVSSLGMVVFLETRKQTPVDIGFPKTLRSAFKPAPQLDISPHWIVQYYREKSLHYADKFGWKMETIGEWEHNMAEGVVDREALKAVLAEDVEPIGRGLLEYVWKQSS
jgi:hypothetical protein